MTTIFEFQDRLASLELVSDTKPRKGPVRKRLDLIKIKIKNLPRTEGSDPLSEFLFTQCRTELEVLESMMGLTSFKINNLH